MKRPVAAGARARLAWLSAGAGFAGAGCALASRGFRWQDEYGHLLFSKWFWAHPALAVDLWGRPLATLAYALPALAGIWPARLLTLALAVLAALWTGRAAERRGLSAPVAMLAVIAQPVFFAFSYGALPGTLFAALLARLLLEDARGRHRHAAVMAALLPLARVEGVLIAVIYLVVLVRRGERRAAVLPLAGLAVWNLAGWAVTGSLLFLLTANPYPAAGSIYPTAGFFYPARVLPMAAGVAVFVLTQVGMVAAWGRPRIEHAMGAVVGAFLVLVWGVPLFASTPTPVYLIGFAPILALLAADGWRALAEIPATRLRALAAVVALEAFVFIPHRTLGGAVRALASPVDDAERVVMAAGFALVCLGMLLAHRRALAAGLLLATIMHLAVAAGPVAATPHERAAEQAAGWYRANGLGRAIASAAPDFLWMAGVDPFVGWEPGALPLRHLPERGLIAWDSHFGAHEGATTLEQLRADGWSEVAAFAVGTDEFRILERR